MLETSCGMSLNRADNIPNKRAIQKRLPTTKIKPTGIIQINSKFFGGRKYKTTNITAALCAIMSKFFAMSFKTYTDKGSAICSVMARTSQAFSIPFQLAPWTTKPLSRGSLRPSETCLRSQSAQSSL
jgi:hypothetical protein